MRAPSGVLGVRPHIESGHSAYAISSAAFSVLAVEWTLGGRLGMRWCPRGRVPKSVKRGVLNGASLTRDYRMLPARVRRRSSACWARVNFCT